MKQIVTGLGVALALVLSSAVPAEAGFATPTGDCWDDPLGDATVVQAAADRFSPVAAPSPLLPVSDSRGDFTRVCGSIVDGRVTATFTVPADTRPANAATERTFSMYVSDIGSCASLRLDYHWGAADHGDAIVTAASDCESLSPASPASAPVPGVIVAHEPSSGSFSVSVPLGDVGTTIESISDDWYSGTNTYIEIGSAHSLLHVDGPLPAEAPTAIDELNFL